MRILVTGSSGQLGTIISSMLSKEHSVIGIDLLSGEFTTHKGNITNYDFVPSLAVMYFAKAHAYNQNIEEALKIFEFLERDTPNTIWSQLSGIFTNALKGKKQRLYDLSPKKLKKCLKRTKCFLYGW